METAKTEARELTRHERAVIRKLVVGMCANYDSEYGCLPLDYGGCYMLDICAICGSHSSQRANRRIVR